MSDRPDVPDSTSHSDSTSPMAGLFLRTWWMFLGNGILLVVLGMMALERDELPSLLDAAFAAVVASLVAARLADVRYFGGCTAEGVRATMGHFRRYALRVLAGSAAGWGVANSVAAL